MSQGRSSLSAGVLIRSMLSGDPAVTQKTRRIYPVVAEDGRLPYVVYRRATLEQQPTKTGRPNADAVQIEVVCYATTYIESVELAEVVRSALDHQQGEYGGVLIRGCYLSDSEELWQDDAFIQSLTFTIRI